MPSPLIRRAMARCQWLQAAAPVEPWIEFAPRPQRLEGLNVDSVIAKPQKIADTFLARKLIPKPVRIADAIAPLAKVAVR